MSRNLLRAVGVISVAVLTATLLSTPAQAANRNGVCESGEFCLYYNSNNAGSMVDLSGSVASYGTGSSCIKFISAGAGRGQCVKNNAASAWNREASYVTVFYKSNYSGAIDNFSPGAKANLRAYLKNENAGHRVGSTSNRTLEYGLYHSSSAQITAYFDGYESTGGRHEGTDIKRYIGAPVYALVSGTVIRKWEGERGRNESSDLSTLAIYHASDNVTVIYLHLNPSVSVGDTISPGERIGVEDWRGISYSSGAHTHVEMRPGRQGYAAPSVNDPNLTNPIPTNFWMNHGFNICCQFS